MRVLWFVLFAALVVISIADCESSIQNTEPELRLFLGEFWGVYDSFQINANFYNWTSAERITRATALVDAYFISNATLTMFFSSGHPNNVVISGRQNLIDWIVYASLELGGGEVHTFGFPRYRCVDMYKYTVVTPSLTMSRAKFHLPTMDTLMASTIRIDLVRNAVPAPFKISFMRIEGQEGFAVSIYGSPKWEAVTEL